MQNKEKEKRYYPNQIQIRLLEITDKNMVKLQVVERNAEEGNIYSVCSRTAYTTSVCESRQARNRISVFVPSGLLCIEILEDQSIMILGKQKEQACVVAAKGVLDKLSKSTSMRCAG